MARFRPGRAAVYAERTRPERLMDPAALHRWTAHLLRPLDDLPHHTRAELLATTRLGLEFTAVSTAKVLGVSRNTVRARMDRVEGMLRTDFADLTARAAVHLALNAQAGLDQLPDGGAPGRAGDARLADLLAGPALRAWAQDLLGRLEDDTRDLRRTLRAWLAVGGNAERAARTLGVHAQTVREHVRSAEPVLERRLLDPAATCTRSYWPIWPSGTSTSPSCTARNRANGTHLCTAEPARPRSGHRHGSQGRNRPRTFVGPRGHDRNGGPVAPPVRPAGRRLPAGP